MGNNIKSVPFDKMQGLGNDYVYITCMDRLPENLSQLAKDISDRHFGIGGDGLVAITASDVADFRMIMFNADGSRAQMCGNASRCIARLVYEKGLTEKTEFDLETDAGIKHLKLNLSDGYIASVTVNMGKPVFQPDKIPVENPSEKDSAVCIHDLEMGNREIKMHCVGMGNPHGVIYWMPDDDWFFTNGPQLECHTLWPEKANIEFVRVLDPHTVEMRVWERGTGETLACGTGACAAAAASILTGRTDNDLTVRMKGGDLTITLDESGDILMTGEAVHVASGIYFWNESKR